MVRAFNRCLQLGEPKRYPTVRGVGTFRCYFNLGLYFELAGDVNSAIHHYDLALAADPSFAPAGLRRSLLGAHMDGVPSEVAQSQWDRAGRA